MAQANLAIEVFSILITLLVLVHLLGGERRGKRPAERLDRLFVGMLLCKLAMLGSDLITWIPMGDAPWARPLLLTMNFCVYAFGYGIVALFTDYLVSYLGTRMHLSRMLVHVSFGLCVGAILLVVLSQFNQMYDYLDAQNVYHRGDWYAFSQAYPLGMTLTTIAVVLRHRKGLRQREVVSLLSYQVLPLIAMLVQIAVQNVMLLYAATTLSLLIIYVSIQMQFTRQLKLREQELDEARVGLMLSQIQPHFLYNSLTAIRQLCDIDPAKAEEAITRFSRYLQANTEWLASKGCIPFGRELAHVENYLALEQMRFEEGLSIITDVRFTDFTIPPLTLQPLVENAVRHGLGPKEGGGAITICAISLGEMIAVSVADDGIGFDMTTPLPKDGRRHVGIENVRLRLESMCGGTLQMTSFPGKGTTATILLPKENTR